MPLSSSSMPRTVELYAAHKRVQNIQEMKSRGFAEGGENKEQEQQMKQATKQKERLQVRLNLSLLLTLLLVVTVVLAILRAIPQKTSLFWLFEVPALPQTVGDFATILAPLLAISVAIERLLETGFNWFEQSSRAVADVLVAPRETLDWIGREYQDAYDATQKASETVGLETSPETLSLLNMAEERLANAEDRLRGWVNAPEYLAWKKAISIWVGLLTGLVVSVLGDLGMLHYIGIPAPRLLDMMVTGLVIGSGPGPMHDLIGILQSGKDALGSVKELAQGKAVREAVAALGKKEEA